MERLICVRKQTIATVWVYSGHRDKERSHVWGDEGSNSVDLGGASFFGW